MSLRFKLYYQLCRHPSPLAQKWAHILEKQLGDKLYAMPYLKGRVYASPVQNIGRHILLTGTYEPTIISIVQSFTEDGFSMVDIGANIGLHTLASLFACKPYKKDSQQWVVFEPEPTTFDRLQTNLQLNNLLEQVHVEQIALGCELGSLPIHTATDANEGSHSLLPRPETALSGTVPVTTLDTVRASCLPLDKPTLVKIDVEGFEASVLSGGAEWLRNLSEAAIIMEVSPNLLPIDGHTAVALLDLLHQFGFTQHIIINDSDTFLPNGLLINDYFNILAWKGERATQIYQRLPLIYTVHASPANAPDLVEWARFTTRPPLTPIQKRLAELQTQAALSVWSFANSRPVIGYARQRWYNIAARWGDQSLAEQQSHFNYQLLSLCLDQQSQLDEQAQQIESLQRQLETRA